MTDIASRSTVTRRSPLTGRCIEVDISVIYVLMTITLKARHVMAFYFLWRFCGIWIRAEIDKSPEWLTPNTLYAIDKVLSCPPHAVWYYLTKRENKLCIYHKYIMWSQYVIKNKLLEFKISNFEILKILDSIFKMLKIFLLFSTIHEHMITIRDHNLCEYFGFEIYKFYHLA